MDEARQLEVDLLCGVIDALPCPAALLNRLGQTAYVSSKQCPVDLDAVGLESREDVRGVLSSGAPVVARTVIEDGTVSCRGLIELYPVRTDGGVVGALMLFHPEEPAHEGRADALPSASAVMNSVWERIQRFSALTSPVLFLGESGVGKSGFAEVLHERSPLKEFPFLQVTKAAAPHELRELSKEPCTVYACRVDVWPPALLETLADMAGVSGRQGLVGAACRIVASAGPDLAERTLAGTFPEPLYTRLHVNTVFIPPLRDRPEDVVPAARAMLEAEVLRCGKHITGFSGKAEAVLKTFSFAENFRDLRDTVRSAVSLCPGGVVLVSHLPGAPRIAPEPLRRMRQAYTLDQINLLLEAYGDSVEGKRRAAQELGIGLSTLYRLLSQEKEPRT